MYIGIKITCPMTAPCNITTSGFSTSATFGSILAFYITNQNPLTGRLILTDLITPGNSQTTPSTLTSITTNNIPVVWVA